MAALIAGGSDGTNPLGTTDLYDPASGTVSAAAAMSTARVNLTATTQLDGRVLVAGGNNGTADLASAEIYDPAAGTFSATGALAAARSGHLAFLLPNNNGVLIAGGSSAGGTSATVTLADNRVAGDVFTDSYTSASFADKNVANTKPVSVSGISISGADAGNYTFNTSASTTANVSAAPLTITAVTNTKSYDGTVTAAATPTFSGVQTGDTVTGLTETYDTKNAGTGKALSVATYMVNDGNGGNNYAVAKVTNNTGVINKTALSITAVANTKTYDATTSAAATPTVTGLQTGDTVAATETYDSKNVGTGKTLSVATYTVNDGNGGNNYTVTTVANTGGVIIKAALTITAVTNTKFYDGTASAAAMPLVTGLQGSDTVTGLAEGYADANAGMNKVLSVAGYTVNDGNGGGNYTVTLVPMTGVISPAPTATILSSTLSTGTTPVVITLTATVTNTAPTPPIPVGTVTFTDTSTNKVIGTANSTLSGGRATMTTDSVSLGAGTHVISVSYAPSINFLSSSSPTNTPPPSVTITGPPSGDVHAVNTVVNFSATYTDPPGVTPSAQWSFDTTASTNGAVDPAGNITGAFTFSAAGVYNVTLTFTDGLGGIAIVNTVSSTGAPPNLTAQVVVYDPNAGFVTGGGWINSAAGSYTWNPSLTGKASFGFVSKYQKGANVPTGETEFNFQVANFNFHSSVYQWLVVSGSQAQYKGTGTINGSGNYNFMLTASDGDMNGGSTPDGFRLKITDPANNGAVVYDNLNGNADTLGNTQIIGGGNIVIHSGK